MHKLWIAYSHTKYRLVGEYASLTEALSEYQRFATYHTCKDDRLKLTHKRETAIRALREK